MIRIGQKLQEERLDRGFSLDEISEATKIKTEFLAAIENSQYDRLPSGYAIGFVQNYAEFLGLPKKETLALFRREFDSAKEFTVLPEGLTKPKDFPSRRVRFGQTGIVIFSAFIVLLVYIVFQFRHLFSNPSVTIRSPKENEVVSVQTIGVSGKTDADTTVFVNGAAASVDANGNFSKNITLFPGKTSIEIRAVNRFGRESKVKRGVIYKPPS